MNIAFLRLDTYANGLPENSNHHLRNGQVNTQGGQNVKGWHPNFVKNYAIGCGNSQKNILLGVLVYKKLYCWVHYFYTQGFTLKTY